MSQGQTSSIDHGDGDVRPTVRVADGNRGIWVFAACMGICAMLLFALLEGRRDSAGTSAIESSAEPGAGRISAPPELIIPGDFAGRLPDGRPVELTSRPPDAAGQPLRQVRGAPEEPAAPRGVRPPGYRPADPPPPLSYVAPLPQVTYETGVARQSPAAAGIDPASQQDRVTAFRFANPATTVPKGAIIPAVLETALDSTRPGFVRAIVSRDVLGFDGSRVLIPRGSRLIGEYKSDLAAGQNRALIQWQRLMRPDGVVINLDSPAVDPLGRAGVRGKVDSHFLERLAGAFLQTAVSIGSQAVLNRTTNNTVIYALPVAGQVPQVAPTDRPQRTLKVKQGSSVSVFVVKDLDFTTVES